MEIGRRSHLWLMLSCICMTGCVHCPSRACRRIRAMPVCCCHCSTDAHARSCTTSSHVLTRFSSAPQDAIILCSAALAVGTSCLRPTTSHCFHGETACKPRTHPSSRDGVDEWKRSAAFQGSQGSVYSEHSCWLVRSNCPADLCGLATCARMHRQCSHVGTWQTSASFC